MIGADVEITAFDEMSKVFDGQVHSEVFTVERAVTSLWWLQRLGKEGDRAPHSLNELLEDCPDSEVGRVSNDARRSGRLGMVEEGGLGEGFFEFGKSCRRLIHPGELLGWACCSQQGAQWLRDPSTLGDKAMVKID